MITPIEKLINNNDIYVYGDKGFCGYIAEYIKHNFTNKIVVKKNENSVSICAVATMEKLNEYAANGESADIFILGTGIISDVFDNNRKAYIKYEEEQKKIELSIEDDFRYVKLFQTDRLYRILSDKRDLYDIDEKQAVRCFWPWFNMYLRGELAEWCCGYRHTEEKLINESGCLADIKSFWNHSSFQKVREMLGGRDLKGNCSLCHNLIFMQFFPYIFDFQLLSEPQEDNLTKAVLHYWKKDAELSSTPARYEIITTFRCNIDCIMCNQETSKENKYSLSAEFFKENRDKLAKALQISLLGGEFFFLKESREIISELADEVYKDTQIMFITNGLSINKFFGELKGINKALFSVSIDGIGYVYNKIRKGSDWNRVERNLLALRDMIRENGLKWEIQIPSVVMLESLKGLRDFTDWCIDKDFSPSFIKIEHVKGVTEDVDIFRYPELLEQVPEWEGIFEDSLSKFKNAGLHNSYSTLASIYSVLKR